MNPQYVQQQQQQPQQPPYYPGPPQGSSPFGEVNSNVQSNVLKRPPPPLNAQNAHPTQKPMQGPPLGNLHPTQPPHYPNNMQVNPQSGIPPVSAHMATPPTSQNNLVNQMSNMSLGSQQRTQSTIQQNFPPSSDKSNMPLPPPLNVNGFDNSVERNTGETDLGKSGSPAVGQDAPAQLPLQQTLPTSRPPSLPFSGPPPPGQNYSSQMFRPELSPQSQQNQSSGASNVADVPAGLNQSRPPLPGQKGQQTMSGHPAGTMGHQNFGSPLGQGQQSVVGSSMPGQQSLSGPPPPLPGQQNFPGPPSGLGVQNLSGPSMQTGQPNLNVPPLQQQNVSGPPFPGQQNLSGPPLSTAQQSLSGPPLPGSLQQQYPMSQQNMPGQPGQIRGPSAMGQMSQIQPHLMSSQGGGPPQSFGGSPMTSQPLPGQKYPPGGPPLPGQTPTSPMSGLSRAPPGGGGGNFQQGASYPPQQGFQNQQADMYGGAAAQRNLYQGGMPPMTGGYQSAPGMQAQQARRLDPEQMPSPIQVIQDDQRTRGGVFETNQRGLVPPLVTTKFVTQDQGNASPRYIRSTMYSVPTTSDIIKQTNVPFGLIISPMARTAEEEYEPPIVDMGEIGPVRCVRCKAYMSPFMQFIDAGRRFQCMFCKATTEVPGEYFQHLDHTGQRMDRYERPELMLGTYEYVATKDYCRNNVFPKPPAIIFVIDVSYNTVKSGLVNLLCARMKSILQNLPIDAGQTKSNMKVGFITYNNTVHFYNVNSCLAQPQMMVVGDVQDVFMPLLDGFLCDVEESEAVIDSLMAQIPAMFADTRETETILAPAIQAGLEALKASDCAGKLMVFHSSLPIAEAPGKLKNRDDRKLLGTDKEKTVLAPQNNTYNNLGQECVGAGCSVDLFIFNNSYVDLATIGQVSRLTGGEIFKYTYFQADIDGDRLIRDVITNISRPIAFDAIMRVRTSTGVRATDFFGHFYMSNTTDMELASIDCNKAVAIEVKHDDKLTDDEGVYIQAALLYTSCGGIRRLRIINLSLKTSSQMAELYRACDLDAIINFFSKQSVFKLIESTPKSIKDNLISRCANMLAAYRKNCASPSSAGQLILPECMKLLPLYINCILKSDAISGGSDMTIDDRSFVMQAVATMPISVSIVYIYPRLLSLHDVDPQDTELPMMLRCSIDKFADDGAYLLENSIHMFLWLGLSLSPQWIQAVFGVPSVVQVDTDRTALPMLDTPLNKRITDIIDRVRTERHRCMRLTIVRQRDKLEMVLRHFLVEDRGNDGSPSYVDFLCHMHKEIRTLLSQ